MVLTDSGLLGFWLRFRSVTGFSNLRLRRRPMIGTTRHKPQILAAHRYIFSVNALVCEYADFLRQATIFVQFSSRRFTRQKTLCAFAPLRETLG
jgi:hypothetical protein